MPEQPVAPSLFARLMALLHDPAYRKQARLRGRKLTGGANACAATNSQYWLNLGIIGKAILGAEELADKLEQTGKFQRIMDLHSIQPGDVIKTKDLNGNGRADHIWLALSKVDNNHWLAVDNRTIEPYSRNIGAGPFTPALYALRLIA